MYPDIIDIDGDRLKQRRESLGLSQSGLAARVSEVTTHHISISRGYLAELELNQKPNGRHKHPRRHIALALAEALNVPITYLTE